jgi:flagellar hook-associated protein FlgK
MSDLLSIGASGVAAYQRALGTVSNNISNVGTEGYVRQETSLSENMPRQAGRVYLGTGVNVAGIKRAYDQFLEQNLRNTTSDFSTQGPMVDYANRVIDIMGSDSIGLTSAIDKFFATTRALSADPASTILRSQFLTDADGLASRFRELSTQITSVDTETRDAISSKISDINTLAQQLATVNKQMSKHPLVDRQPSDLLDQRDLLLTKLSKLVSIRVTTAQNGSVDVSIGTSVGAANIVTYDVAVPLMPRFDEADLSRVSIIADPYSRTPSEVVGISAGELGGLLGFREQVLQPTMNSLDYLATQVAKEMNAIHTNGIDLRGNKGADLFNIQQIKRTDSVSGATVTFDRAAAGIRLALAEPGQVAAAALFRVIENDKNLSGVNATLSYDASYIDPAAIKPLSALLKNNANPTAAINSPKNQLLGQIPVASDDWTLYLHNATSTQQLAMFTRDGRQLTGAKLTADEREALITTNNGFVAGSTYSDQYLNKSGEYGYKQFDVFYGIKASPILQYNDEAKFNGTTHGLVPAAIPNDVKVGTAIPAGMERITANILSINGKALPELQPAPPSTTIQASDMVSWINLATDGMAPPVTASAMTTIEVAGNDIDVNKDLIINGLTIPAPGDRTPTTATSIDPGWPTSPDLPTAEQKAFWLAKTINDFNLNNNTKVVVSVDGNTLVIQSSEDYPGQDIVIGAVDGGNAIGMAAQTVNGTLKLDSEADITLGYGPDGELGDLDKFGRPVGTYLMGVMSRVDEAAQIRGFRMPAGVTGIAGGTLRLNRSTLPALTLPSGQPEFQAKDYVNWINSVGSKMSPPVIASASNEVRVSGSQLNLNGLGGLTINGVTITLDSGKAPQTETELALAINSAIEQDRESGTNKLTGLAVDLTADGGIAISSADGSDISIGSSVSGGANWLGAANGKYKGSLTLTSDAEIRFGFASGAQTPSELAKLGLSTSVYVDSPVSEDLLVFVTGEGSGTVAGTYNETMKSPDALDETRIATLRSQDFDVTFTTENHYQITWTNTKTGTKTILAERDYDPASGIVYQGIKLMLDRPPAAGDTFIIDGNQDGSGDNQNLQDLLALQTKGVIGGQGGMTLAQAYQDQISKVSNFSSQANIAQKALQVVNQQAVDARDKVSGVSLDSEAADLIRFQQAYQASAKAMQTASTLFEAILNAAR